MYEFFAENMSVMKFMIIMWNELTLSEDIDVSQANKTSKSMHWLAELIQFLEASRMNDVAISELRFSRRIEWKSLI